MTLLIAGSVHAYTNVRSEHDAALTLLKERLKDSPDDVKILTEIGERLTLWMSNHEDERAEVPLATFYLQKAQSLDPTNSLPVAWMGILTMVQAKSASLFDKKDIAKSGLALLDKAVSMDPNQPKVRLLRGSVSVKLPDSFERHGQALEDLLLVQGAVKATPSLVETQNISLCVLYLNLGKAYRHLADDEKALQHWELALKYEPGRDENRQVEQLISSMVVSQNSGWARFSSWGYRR